MSTTADETAYPPDRFIEVNGIRARYWDIGAGSQTVLLVHGWACSCEEWGWTIPALTERFRVLVPDLPGHGRTDKPDASYTYEYLVAFMHGFLAAMGVERAHVIGHSMGGAAALQFALTYPAAVQSLSCIAPAYGTHFAAAFRLFSIPFVGELLLTSAKSPEDIRKSQRVVSFREVAYPAAMLERLFEFQCSPGHTRALLKLVRNYFHPFGMRRAARQLRKTAYERLPGFSVPVFLVWGRQDAVVSFENSAELRQLLPRLKFWDVDECGHMPHAEYPEELNGRLLAFLAAN